jgi:HD-like signal output (HDOD) protein
MSTLQASPNDSAMIDQVVRRASKLYSLPAVAAEVLELTKDPAVDAAVLKKCIECDPALTAKLLRVVNSSLFGLSGHVSDLNQALAMLGVKPLKLLVLGFSLPETLFLTVAAEQLRWYWSSTLARAVAAREINEQLLGRPGDDAFVAGLLQDIGALALLGELGPPYARFLDEVIASGSDLHQMEVASLGFGHTELTAAMLTNWKMPSVWVEAIAEPRLIKRLARGSEPHIKLARTLHVAELLGQLVGARRLSVLAELLEACDAYFGCGDDRLRNLVATLEPKVQQLADVLTIETDEELSYVPLLLEAHQQLANVAESVAAPLSLLAAAPLQDAACEYLQSAAQQVAEAPPDLSPVGATAAFAAESGTGATQSVTSLLNTNAKAAPSRDSGTTEGAQVGRAAFATAALAEQFAKRLTLAVGSCRSRRESLSLALLAIDGFDGLDPAEEQTVSQLLDAALVGSRLPEPAVVRSPTQRLLLLPACDRREAVAIASNWVERLRILTKQLYVADRLPVCVVAAGVASCGLPPRNFPPLSLLETAERCLGAAMGGNTGGVKSLEIS